MDNAVGHYFREVARHRCPTPAEERTALAEIKRLDLETWALILTEPAGVEATARLCDELAPPRSHTTRPFPGRRSELPARLRYFDIDRIIIGALLRSPPQGPAGWWAEVVRTERRASAARNDFAHRNLRLVMSFVRRFCDRGMDLEDLLQEGNLGLLRAIQRYDGNRGYRFSTYAAWWIRHSMRRAVAVSANTVRVPVHRADSRPHLLRLAHHMAGELGRTPTLQELATEAKLSEESVRLTLRPAHALSLDVRIDADGDTSFLDQMADDAAGPLEQIIEAEGVHVAHKLMTCLRPTEREVIARRFGLRDDRSETLYEVGEAIGKCRERIRQIERDALRKMRKAASVTGVA